MMLRQATSLFLILLISKSLLAEELLDPEFLEWLAQISEVEELGVDVDALLENQQLQSQNQSREGEKK